jgi:hypothetical protein
MGSVLALRAYLVVAYQATAPPPQSDHKNVPWSQRVRSVWIALGLAVGGDVVRRSSGGSATVDADASSSFLEDEQRTVVEAHGR